MKSDAHKNAVQALYTVIMDAGQMTAQGEDPIADMTRSECHQVVENFGALVREIVKEELARKWFHYPRPGDLVKVIGIDPESDFQEFLGKTGTVSAVHDFNDIEIIIEGQPSNTFYSFAAHNLEKL